MARTFFTLFCVILLFSHLAFSNALGYCSKRSPAVRLCNEDSGHEPIVYVDTYYVPAFVNMTCVCKLYIENGNQNVDIGVSRLRTYDSNIDIFINNNTALVSSDFNRFPYTPGIAIKFEMTESQYIEQCYRFEIDRSLLTEALITVICSKPVYRVPSTTTSASTKPEPTTNGLQTESTSNALETSQVTTTVNRKSGPTADGLQTDTETNTIGIALGATASVVVVLAVTVVLIVFAWRRKRNINRKQTEQEQSATTYYNVGNETGTDVSTHNPIPNEYVNMQSSSDLNPPATYESLQTPGQREDDHSYQTVIAGGDGDYVNADYEEPITNDKSGNYTTLQQPTEHEHVYKTNH